MAEILRSGLGELLKKGRSMVFEQTLTGIIKYFEGGNYLEYVSGEEHIEELKKSVYDEKTGKYLPTIFAFHHVGKPELFWVIRLAFDLYGKDPSRLFLPFSEDYADPGVYFAYSMAVSVGKHIGQVELFPVRQAYRDRQGKMIRESDKVELNRRRSRGEGELRRDYLTMHKNFIRGMRSEFFKGKCMIIAPAGHRSVDGGLLPAEDGVGTAIDILDEMISAGTIPNAFIIPIGINVLDRKLPDRRERLGMVIGKHLTPSEIKKKAGELARFHNLPLRRSQPTNSQLAHTLMLEMAELVDNKGVYGEFYPLFGGVLRGDAVLGTDKERYVGLINWPR